MTTKEFTETMLKKILKETAFEIHEESVAFALNHIANNASKLTNKDIIDTLVFDVDDTLYTFECGFTVYRNTKVIEEYMVAKLGFKDRAAAKAFRDPLFKIHHSSVKIFQLASDNGTLPLWPDGTRPVFHSEDLAIAFASCDMHTYLDQCVDTKLFEALRELKQAGMKIVAFSNAPHKYCLRVLKILKLLSLFDEDKIFGVDDTMPLAKPDPKTFHYVLDKVGSRAENSIMFEDSMKNIRSAKSIGMKTCLVTGRAENAAKNKDMVMSIKAGDCPDAQDECVDYALGVCSDMVERLPFLWHKTWRQPHV